MKPAIEVKAEERESDTTGRNKTWSLGARGFALFAALLTLMNLLGNLAWPGFDANDCWIRFGALPAWASRTLLGLFAATMLAFAMRRIESKRAVLTAVVAIVFSVIALADAITFFRPSAATNCAGFPAPLSPVMFAGLLIVAREAWRGHYSETPGSAKRRRLPLVLVCGLCFLLFPLGLIIFFGNRDYRRPADAVVVFGARVYANGRMSDALEDRIRTGCEIYRSGLTRRMVLSGGQGDGPVTEAQAMRAYALSHGVREEDIVLDDQGRNSAATVRNTVPLFRQWHAHRVLAVSHFYHLPRIKLAYQRAGLDVCTVPAPQARILAQLPFNVAREIPGFWAYYFRQLPAAERQP